MKILFLGPLAPFGRDTHRRDILLGQGHEVRSIETFPHLRSSSGLVTMLERALWRLRIPMDRLGANAEIVRLVSEWNPDLVWIEKGVNIYPRTLRAVRALSPDSLVVGFQEDNLVAWWHWSVYFRLGAKHYDLMFTKKSSNCRPSELPAWGVRRVVYVPAAFDGRIHRPLELSAEERERFESDVVFVGRYEPIRAEAVLRIASEGFRVRVWGDDRWRRVGSTPENLQIVSIPVKGDDYAKALCASRIALNILSRLVPDRHTGRSVEIPACGAFMLAERTEEHLQMFREDEEAAYFDSPEEMLAKIRLYLSDEERRLQIARNGRRRCLEGGYDQESRVRQVLETVAALRAHSR